LLHGDTSAGLREILLLRFTEKKLASVGCCAGERGLHSRRGARASGAEAAAIGYFFPLPSLRGFRGARAVGANGAAMPRFFPFPPLRTVHPFPRFYESLCFSPFPAS